MMVELTEHVCLRYIERVNPNLASIADYKKRLKQAELAISYIMQSAHYVSDDHRGVLLHSKQHNCNLIVRNRKLITLYIPSKKKKSKKGKGNERNK